MAQRGLPELKITEVKVILTAPNRIRLVIVKVETSEPGLYGLGCATFTQRPLAVASAVTDYLRPFLIGKDPERIEDIVELLHDIHERIPPIQAIGLAKDLEPYHLFFLEDPFAPEDVGYFKLMRQQTGTPIAMGELFNNPLEYVPLIQDRLIDFIRIQISQIGGISPARKLAALSEFFGVRTAWHGPGDVSPVGHAANLALDLACYNFGIQEEHAFSAQTQEVFPGCPEIHDGYLWPNERPGLGIDVNEELAAKFPFAEHRYNGAWEAIRMDDGTVIRP